jgi:hypothetical protein
VEADWSVEIGAGLAVIEADWPGFVDVRRHPFRLAEIAEANAYPALRDVLIELNDPFSRMFSVKSDVWALETGEIDADEFGCTVSETRAGLASYVDLVLLDDLLFSAFAWHERWVRAATDRLHVLELSGGRVELVVRVAVVGGREGFGVTLYAAGCGVDTQAARRAWQQVLSASAAATIKEARASSSIG